MGYESEDDFQAFYFQNFIRENLLRFYNVCVTFSLSIVMSIEEDWAKHLELLGSSFEFFTERSKSDYKLNVE